MQLRQKFFLFFSILALVPLFLFSYLVISQYTALVNERIRESAENIMEQAVRHTDQVLEDMESILEIVQTDSPIDASIFKELKKYTADHEPYQDSEIYESNLLLKNTFMSLLYSTENINGIFIFTPAGEILGQGYGNGVDVRSDYLPAGDEWYQKTLDLNGEFYVEGVCERPYLVSDSSSISFSVTIYDVYTREFMGVLYISCSPQIFSLDSLNILPEAAQFYIQRDEELIYSNTEETLDPERKNTIVFTETLPSAAITLTAVFEKETLQAGMERVYILILSAILTLIVLFVFISFLLARYLTKPICQLSAQMSGQKEEEDFSQSPYFRRKDEIGILFNEYQHMLTENQHYIKTQYEDRLILMDAQMKALEAQINAHFLYNTLEAINSIAEIEGVASISVMAQALGDMFRYSIRTKGEMVELREELSHVRNFVAIELIRFENGFSFIEEVPDELLTRQVLKLILQPLVENALCHGLMNCNAGSFIRLTGEEKDGRLIFTVSDDGAGMDEKTLADIRASLLEKPKFQTLEDGKKDRIGLKNIHSRIQLYYGEDYGISIESRQGAGTAVTVAVPVRIG